MSAEFLIPVQNYDLGATLDSGQAFRWQREGAVWTGVIGQRWVRLQLRETGIHAETFHPATDWEWLTHYLQSQVDLTSVIKTFPVDPGVPFAICSCALRAR